MIAPLVAAMILLHQPIDCTLGKTCFIQNYVDQDRSTSWHDFQCRHLSYDGHKGTDFRLINEAQMQRGVKVLAAADGTVLATRDGMEDVSFRLHNGDAIANRECGNGVLLKHQGGYVTQYCHLKENSVVVAQGQKVVVGTPLGEVGLSGQTEFPHVHLELRDAKGAIIDPFLPDPSRPCGGKQAGWWHNNSLHYQASGVLQAGFVSAPPTVESARKGQLDDVVIDQESPALILWAELFGLAQGDKLRLTIMDAQKNTLVDHRQPIESNKAVFFQFAGKKKPQNGWQKGSYQGTIALTRNGKPYVKKKLRVEM